MTSIVSGADLTLTLAALLVGALALPLIGTIVLVGAGKRLGHGPQRARLATVLAGIATLSLLGLLAYPDYELHLPVWLPSAGPMRLHLGGLGGRAALATSTLLLLGLLLSPPDSRTSWALLLTALSAANISFLAGDFLTRYGALEILGLGIALAPLAEGLRNGMRKAKEVYLFLRLGDVGLLIAILVLMKAGGTLAIGDALDAGARLSGAPLGWVVGGMLTAVWVKTGAWPFHRWQAASDGLSPLTGAWLYGLVMPNLGVYLLYRITPLLALEPLFGPLTLGLSSIGILAVTGRLLGRRSRSQLPVHVNAALGCVALGIAATGRQDLLAWLLLLATPLRLAVWLTMRGQPSRAEPAADSVGQTSPEDWLLRLAQTVNLVIEDRILQQGVVKLWHAVVGTAHFWYRIGERDGSRPWRAVVGTAHLWHRVGEQDGVGHMVRTTARSALSISYWLQGSHTGRLRRNLQWVVLGFVAILTFVVATGW
ncbi:MAG: hypothetical protein MUQ30_13360 [Anaerolineae bacterium]|nr:hypothetical protein [Anaerolineae bacterium]